ncbi:MAG: nitrilase-related carbon-nitrogen hydrolase [Gammaproteobacteria bacterium]
MTTTSSYAWLLLGGVLQVFGFGKWIVPLAAWLAPVFLLHCARGAQPSNGFLWFWLSLFIALSVGNRDVIPLPGPAFFGVVAAMAITMTLPFIADRLLAPHLSGFLSTLIFPASWIASEYVAACLNPYGTWGALGYTQYGNLPLMQLAAVTGIWGIGFLVTWFAAVINSAWDRQFDWGAIQNGVLPYVAVWSLVMLAGGARLAFSPEVSTVRIAGIGWPQGIIEPSEFMRVIAPDFSAAERKQVREKFVCVQDSFFERSQREVLTGAKIVVWPEANLMVLKEDEAAFLDRARRFARDNDIFLLMGMGVLEPVMPRPVENKAVLLNPAGETAFSYTKITAVPGFEASVNVRGQGPIPVADTPYGRIASPICFDLDFPQIIRQVGRSEAEIMLVPASDWKAITRLHQLMAEFRAVENGVAMFRITRWGGSGAIDPYGRRLAAMDDFTAQDSVMVAQVPASAGVDTIYVRMGDLFAWGCVVGLLASIAWRVFGA